VREAVRLAVGSGRSALDLAAANLRRASLPAEGRRRGAVLVSYVVEPFGRRRAPGLFSEHTHHWESLQVARTFSALGFDVDVISYQNRLFRPRKHYSYVVDARRNLERLGSMLPDDCTRILHADTCHMLFQNAGELGRLLELQRRRGTTLQPRRVERLNQAIEHADCAVVLGNDHTMSTWGYAGKPMFPVPVSTPALYDPPEAVAGRPSFVWLSRGGLVLKGLDRVLEAFARMPDLDLTVCAPLGGEPDFVAAYHRELHQTPNIFTWGWTDVTGARFRQLLRRSLGIVFPSASESQSGGVLNAMHGGLIPLVTRETGVDVTPARGVVLPDPAVATIVEAVRALMRRPADELQAMRRAAWQHVRDHHTRSAFAARYRSVVEEIMAAGPRLRHHR
jgi:glycosyltransferase involved in cell wall biosynthesis